MPTNRGSICMYIDYWRHQQYLQQMSMEEEAQGEVMVVPFFVKSHVYPCSQLCVLLSSMHYKTTLIISSELKPSIPRRLLQNPLFRVAECPAPLPPHPSKWGKSGPDHIQIYFTRMADFIESLLHSPGRTLPGYAVLDSMMCHHRCMAAFAKFRLPVAAMFTCGASSIAMEHAAWKADVGNLRAGENRVLPGLPEELRFGYSDLTVRRKWSPDNRVGKKKSFPTEPGDEPPWVEETEGVVAFLVNTCEELEGPLMEYLSGQVGAPVRGVGPLLPQEYWNPNAEEISGPKNDRQSNYSDEEITKWLNTKPSGSVIYICFGSELTPDFDELEELAKALSELHRPFIWVLGAGVSPKLFLDGERGLIIDGWAPQKLILSHTSTGGFLTHGGWSSTMEAIGRGVPTLVWPIRGDQFYNGKCIESYFQTGFVISKRDGDDGCRRIKKDAIVGGIERLMSDGGVRRRAKELRREAFEHGFPPSSVAALHTFKGFISSKCPS